MGDVITSKTNRSTQSNKYTETKLMVRNRKVSCSVKVTQVNHHGYTEVTSTMSTVHHVSINNLIKAKKYLSDIGFRYFPDSMDYII